ncbi:uncharacterized protein LOC114804726 [Zeugodacus cucurbitae]|uniref:uncharacterized protein LOC114804726 n=1 Tax=Zeugodacus cucurbitae TaxID=28588 RepID=UPI0023D94248|nr:uncharacterized protein LOC114804726 [Zeugodacus cucurbitae]
MKRVAKGWRHALSFNGVYFRSGMLLVDCRDEETATRLTEIAPKLEGWDGPVPNEVFLPRNADEPLEFAMELITAQNEGINTSAWRIIDSKNEDSGIRLYVGIDDVSYKILRKSGFRLNFRFSAVHMRPWRPKPAEGKGNECAKVQGGAETSVKSAPLDSRRAGFHCRCHEHHGSSSRRVSCGGTLYSRAFGGGGGASRCR